MICMELRIRVQRHSKVFRCITAYGGKILKLILNIFIALDIIMKLTYAINMYKNLFPKKKDLNNINILHADSHKSFLIHYNPTWRILMRSNTFIFP